MAIYAYMQGIYAYIELGKHIYRPYIYVCHVFLCVFMLFSCCIYANECKLVQIYAPLHIARFTVEFWTELWDSLGSGGIFSSANYP